MEVTVTVKARHTVKPYAQTWTGTMPLSEWDQIGYISHANTLYFYKPPRSEKWLNDTNIDAVFQRLRVSLSQTLVHFYPLAGRLRWIDESRLALDCNQMGAQFIEAESDWKLEDFGDFSASVEFRALTPNADYVNVPINEIPILVVQVTSFKCGGISISVTMSHVVGDGPSIINFISEWARIAGGGKPLGTPPPIFGREMIIGASENYKQVSQFDHSGLNLRPILIGKTDNVEERKKKTTVTMLKLTEKQVEALKKMANEGKKNTCSDRAYTRYEIVTAHIWKCACKARRHAFGQHTGVVINVDFRNRVSPPLPQKYSGNAVLDVIVRARSDELTSNSLSYASSKIREAIGEVTNEYVCSAHNLLRNEKDLSKFQYLHAIGSTKGLYNGNPNIAVTSWLTLPMHGMDFGWGREIYMGTPDLHDVDGNTFILPSRDGDGSLIVALCLQVAHIEKFSKYFYDDIIYKGVSKI